MPSWSAMPLTDQEQDASLTVRLDRWASMLRNANQEEMLGLTDDEFDDLSTLLTEAANEIVRRGSAPAHLRTWIEARLEVNRDRHEFPVGTYREGKDKAWRDALAELNRLAPQ